MRHLGPFIVVSAIAVVGLAFIHPFGNPRIEPSKGLDTLLNPSPIPPEARQVLVAKCANCHSNETHWPVYSRLAPGSWLIERDIVEGRKKMNLSNWAEISPDAQQIMIGKILHEANEGEMPPVQYRLLHWKSQLTAQDLLALSTMRTKGQEASQASSAGDPVRGKAVFEKRCTGCHDSDSSHEGPPLVHIFGKKAGSAPGFNYSAALKASGITWNESTLETWLTDPDAMVPGNKMDFHLPRAQERSDVIAYFKR